MKEEEKTPQLKPVDIIPEESPQKEVQKLVLITPQGHRIEGLDIAGMAALLRILP